jgi:metal-responsive CopG/Arc/MetJ family transcriptional regulator
MHKYHHKCRSTTSLMLLQHHHKHRATTSVILLQHHHKCMQTIQLRPAQEGNFNILGLHLYTRGVRAIGNWIRCTICDAQSRSVK